MFEQTLCNLINRYLGEIIDPVDWSNTKLQVGDGDVVLRNVRIRSSFLEQCVGDVFGRGMSARVQMFRIRIPWTGLWSLPSIVELDGIIIELNIDKVRSTGASYHGFDQDWKWQLSNLESDRVINVEKILRSMDNTKGSWWFESIKKKLLHSILENFIVELKNIQISVVVPERGVSLEIQLDLFKIMKGVTDMSNNSSSADVPIRKRCIIKDLQIAVLEDESDDEWTNEDAKPILSRFRFVADFNMFLTDTGTTKPQFDIAVQLPPVEFFVSRRHMAKLNHLMNILQENSKTRALALDHEACKPLIFNARSMWIYAIRKVMEQNRTKCNWRRAAFALAHRDDYIALYKTFFEGASTSYSTLRKRSLDDYSTEKLNSLERIMSLNTILLFRTIAELELLLSYSYGGWVSRALTANDRENCICQALNIHGIDISTGWTVIKPPPAPRVTLHLSCRVEKVSVLLEQCLLAELSYFECDARIDQATTDVRVTLFDLSVSNTFCDVPILYASEPTESVWSMRYSDEMSDKVAPKLVCSVAPILLVYDLAMVQRIKRFMNPELTAVVAHVVQPEDLLLEHISNYEKYRHAPSPIAIMDSKPPIEVQVSIRSPSMILVDDILLDEADHVSPRDALVLSLNSIHIATGAGTSVDFEQARINIGRYTPVGGEIIRSSNDILACDRIHISTEPRPWSLNMEEAASNILVDFGERIKFEFTMDRIRRLKSIMKRLSPPKNAKTILPVISSQYSKSQVSKPKRFSDSDISYISSKIIKSTKISWQTLSIQLDEPNVMKVCMIVFGNANSVNIRTRLFESYMELSLDEIFCKNMTENVVLLNLSNLTSQTKSTDAARPDWFETPTRAHNELSLQCEPIKINLYAPTLQNLFALMNSFAESQPRHDVVIPEPLPRVPTPEHKNVTWYVDAHIPMITVTISEATENVAELVCSEIWCKPHDTKFNEESNGARITVHSLRLKDCVLHNEYVLWHATQWGCTDVDPGLHLLNFDASYNHCSSLLIASIRVAQPRICLFVPILSRILETAIRIIPPMEESTEPILIPDCKVSFFMEQLSVVVPSAGCSPDIPWSQRDHISFGMDSLEVEFTHGATQGKQLRAFEYIDDLFFDPDDTASDVPDMQVSVNISKILLETHMFSKRMRQRIFETSVALSVGILLSGEKGLLNVDVWPLVFCLSQDQYRMFLAVGVEFSSLSGGSQTMPTAVHGVMDMDTMEMDTKPEPAETSFRIMQYLEIVMKVESMNLHLFRKGGSIRSRSWTDEKALDADVEQTLSQLELVHTSLTKFSTNVTVELEPLSGGGHVMLENIDIHVATTGKKMPVLLKRQSGEFFSTIFSCDKDHITATSTLADVILHAYELREAIMCYSQDFAPVARPRVESLASTMTPAEPAPAQAIQTYSRIPCPWSINQKFTWSRIGITLTPIRDTDVLVFEFGISSSCTSVKNSQIDLNASVHSIQLSTYDRESDLFAEHVSCMTIIKPIRIALSASVDLTDEVEDVIVGEIICEPLSVSLGNHAYRKLLDAQPRSSSDTRAVVYSDNAPVQEVVSGRPPQTMLPPKPRKIIMNALFHGLSIEIIEDWKEHKPPVLCCAVNNIQVEMTEYNLENTHSQIRMDAEAELSVQVWNPRVAQWDYGIEPWLIHVGVDLPEFLNVNESDPLTCALHENSESLLVRERAVSFVTVEAPQVLNFNVSRSIAQQLEALQEIISLKDRRLQRVYSTVVASGLDHDVFVQNNTGLDINARIVNISTASLEESSKVYEYRCWAWKAIPSGSLYQRRYFVVRDYSLVYYRSLKRYNLNKPSGIIPLNNGDIYIQFESVIGAQHIDHATAKLCAFQLVTAHRTFSLVTFSLEDKRKLVAAITTAMHSRLAHSVHAVKHAGEIYMYTQEKKLLHLNLEGPNLTVDEVLDSTNPDEEDSREYVSWMNMRDNATISTSADETSMLLVSPDLCLSLVMDAQWFEALESAAYSNDMSRVGSFADTIEHGSRKLSVDLLLNLSNVHTLLQRDICSVRTWILPCGLEQSVSLDLAQTGAGISVKFELESSNAYAFRFLKFEFLSNAGKVSASGSLEMALHDEKLASVSWATLVTVYEVDAAFGKSIFDEYLGSFELNISLKHEDGVDESSFGTRVANTRRIGISITDDEADTTTPYLVLTFEGGAFKMDSIPFSDSGMQTVAVEPWNMMPASPLLGPSNLLFEDSDIHLAARYLICDVYYESEQRIARLRSCASIKNRLANSVELTMTQLYANVPLDCRHTNESYVAFDNRIDTFWSAQSSNAWKIEYEYADKREREVLLYSMVSSVAGDDAPRRWTVQARDENGEWIGIDEQEGVSNWKSLESRTFAIPNPIKSAAYRVQFDHGSDVRIGNIVLFSRENMIYGQIMPPSKDHKKYLKPQYKFDIPISILRYGSAIRFGSGPWMLLYDLLCINVYEMAKPLQSPSLFCDESLYSPISLGQDMHCVSHLSIHTLRDHAKTANESQDSAPLWVLTLDAPVTIENLLPFPIQCNVNLGAGGEAVTPRALVQEGSTQLYTSMSLAMNEEAWRYNSDDSSSASEALYFEFSVLKDEQYMNCPVDQRPAIIGGATFSKSHHVTYSCEISTLKFQVEVQCLVSDSDDAVHAHHNSGVLQENLPARGFSDYLNFFSETKDRRPRVYYRKSHPPVKIVLFSPILIFNYSGLNLSYKDDSRHGTKESKTKIVPLMASSRGLTSRVLEHESTDKLVHVSLFSSENDKMRLTIVDDKYAYDWSRAFSLAVGVNGEVHIPALGELSMLHQVGVAITAGVGRFIRTKIVTLTPRFVVVNETQLTIKFQQLGAPNGTWQYECDPFATHPFHPIDVNGDGKLDDKDFSVVVGAFDEDGSCVGMSNAFRVDILKSFIMQLFKSKSANGDGAMVPVDWTNALGNFRNVFLPERQIDDVKRLQVNIELRENVVRILVANILPSHERSVDYRIDNRCPFARIGIIQHGHSRSRHMRYIGPEETEVEWNWTSPEGSHKVELDIEFLGFFRSKFGAGTQRKHATLDFDKVGNHEKIRLGEVEIEIFVIVVGVTKVLVVESTRRSKYRNNLRKLLSDQIKLVDTQLSDVLKKYDITCDLRVAPERSCSVVAKEKTIVWSSIAEESHVVAYSMWMPHLRDHPKKWQIYGLENEEWQLIDTQDFIGRSLNDFVIKGRLEQELSGTLFRLPRVSSCSTFKLKLISQVAVDMSQITMRMYETKSTPVNQCKVVWGCVVEARDLPIKDMYSSDPYVRVNYGPHSFVSRTVSSQLNPIFDEEFMFPFQPGVTNLGCEVYDKDLILKDDFMGKSDVHVNVLYSGQPLDVWLPLSDGKKSQGQVRIVLQMLDREPDKSYTPVIRFSAMLVQHLEIQQRLDRLLKLHGGHRNKALLDVHYSHTRERRGMSRVANKDFEHYLTLSISESRMYTIPKRLLDKEFYCVVTYGDQFRRSDPVRVREYVQLEVEDPLETRTSDAGDQFLEVTFLENAPLGIQVECDAKNDYFVTAVAANSQASKHEGIVPGLQLVQAGKNVITRDFDLQTVRSILSCTERPVTMRFYSKASKSTRRSSDGPTVTCNIEWKQSLQFHTKDTLRAYALEMLGGVGQELAGRHVCVSLICKDSSNQPVLDLSKAEEDERNLLLPLMYLYGDDVEVDTRLRRTQKESGDSDILIGETHIWLPDVDEYGEEILPVESELVLGHRSIGSLSASVGWVTVPKSRSSMLMQCVDLRMAGVGISLVEPKRDLLYVSLGDIRYYRGNHFDGRVVHDVRVGRLQIDNQTLYAVHPIVLCAAPHQFSWLQQRETIRSKSFSKLNIAKYTSDAMDFPAVLVTLVTKETNHPSVSYVEYFDCFLQEMDLKLEENLLSALQDYFVQLTVRDMDTNQVAPTEKGTESSIFDLLETHPLDWINSKSLDVRSIAEETRILIERADMKPIRINFTFSMTSDSYKSGDARLKILHLLHGVPILDSIASALVTSVVNVSNASLKLNGITICNQNKSTSALRTTFLEHIRNQVLANIASWTGNVLASADLLGSPVQLLGSFGQGAYSFFYEPALAMSMGGYASIGAGLGRGGKELFRTTLHGLSYSLEKLAESVSRVLSQASLDSRFIVEQSRKRNDVVNEPVHIGEGIIASTYTLTDGIANGILDVFRQPVRDIQAYGAVGIFTGTGKGLLGILLKPLIALADSAALFLKGMSNQTDSMVVQQLPVRLRRLVTSNGWVRPYSVRESIGFEMLRVLRIHNTNLYVHHDHVSCNLANVVLRSHPKEPRDEKSYVILVTNRLLCLLSTTSYSARWSVPLEVIGDVQVVHQNRLIIHVGTASDMTNQMGIQVACRSAECAHTLMTMLHLARFHKPWYTTGVVTDLRAMRAAAHMALRDPVGALERAKTIKEQVLSVLDPEPEPDSLSMPKSILGASVSRAVITSRRLVVKDSGPFLQYRIVVASAETELCWVVWRRFSEFHALRNRIAKALSKAKTALPLPSRLPWRQLSTTSLNERQLGLNDMLKTLTSTPTVAELIDVKLFLTRDAEQACHDWDQLLQEDEE